MAYSTLGVTCKCNKLVWGPLPDGLFPSSKPKAQTGQHYWAVGSVKASAGLCKQGVDSASPLSEFGGHRCGASLSPLLCFGAQGTNRCLLVACLAQLSPKPTRIFASSSTGFRSGFKTPRKFVLLQFSPPTYPSFFILQCMETVCKEMCHFTCRLLI